MHYENRTVSRLSTLLDPRYKKKGFRTIQNADDITKHVQTVVTKQMEKMKTDARANVDKSTTAVTGDGLLDFLEEEDEATPSDTVTADAIILTEMYLKTERIPREANPLTFWFENRTTFSPIIPTVLKTLCIPGSSVPCERLFSHSGYIVTARRNRLSPNTVQMLTVLNLNYKLVLKFFEREYNEPD